MKTAPCGPPPAVVGKHTQQLRTSWSDRHNLQGDFRSHCYISAERSFKKKKFRPLSHLNIKGSVWIHYVRQVVVKGRWSSGMILH